MTPWGWRGSEPFWEFMGPHRDPHAAKHDIESCYGHVALLLCRTKRGAKIWLYQAKLRFGGKRKMFYTEEEAKAWVIVMVRM